MCKGQKDRTQKSCGTGTDWSKGLLYMGDGMENKIGFTDNS